MRRFPVYTKRLHKTSFNIVSKRGIYHIRKRVPAALVATIGKREIWKSLKTDSKIEAIRRSHAIRAQIEYELAHARLESGTNVDKTLLQPYVERSASMFSKNDDRSLVKIEEPTLGDVFDRFLNDPTQSWSARTRLAYETTRRLANSAIGASTPINLVNRSVCRDFLETLRFLPKSSYRAFPSLNAKEASLFAKSSGYADIISASNANTYLNKLCVVFNWAVREELLVRNHLKGLRLVDPVNRMEKRLPFSNEQLEAIFSAPLFVGCQDDNHGYGRTGDARPKQTRFWVPVIALYSGMRLNEICQLDTTDVREVDGIRCFIISAKSQNGSTDKHLKTKSSERIVPIHSDIWQLGFSDFLTQRRCDGQRKLFFDICAGQNGIRSTAFSKWFAMFLNKTNAKLPRTSFHSFRHNFRDGLRRGKVDREVAMMLGGWGNGTKSGRDVSDDYGSGFDSVFLAREIQKVSFKQINALAALMKSAQT